VPATALAKNQAFLYIVIKLRLFMLENGTRIKTKQTRINIEDVFNELYIQWREHSKFDSFIGNSTDIYYEKIIQLGDSVVPFIISKLRKEHAHLFIALNRITGENPVKKENMGKVGKMAEDWIQWWDKREHDKI
jgi:hypothetical protein